MSKKILSNTELENKIDAFLRRKNKEFFRLDEKMAVNQTFNIGSGLRTRTL